VGSVEAPKTAEELARAGIVFTLRGGRVTCAGPRGRGDLYDALCAQIDRRVVVMRARISRAGWVLPRIVLVSPDPPEYGACGCCGDPLPPYRGGDCVLCILALERALRAEGRLP